MVIITASLSCLHKWYPERKHRLVRRHDRNKRRPQCASSGVEFQATRASRSLCRPQSVLVHCRKSRSSSGRSSCESQSAGTQSASLQPGKCPWFGMLRVFLKIIEWISYIYLLHTKGLARIRNHRRKSCTECGSSSIRRLYSRLCRRSSQDRKRFLYLGGKCLSDYYIKQCISYYETLRDNVLLACR